MKTFGEKLKAIRKDRNMTQQDVAFQIGIAPNNYAKIERDEADITLSRITQIAGVFEMTVSEVFNYDEPKDKHLEKLETCQNLLHEKEKLIHEMQKELMKALKK